MSSARAKGYQRANDATMLPYSAESTFARAAAGMCGM